jgi:hypothetical protein
MIRKVDSNFHTIQFGNDKFQARFNSEKIMFDSLL